MPDRHNRMIGDWTNSRACRSRAHCVVCRTQEDWRTNVGAPETCPVGLTELTAATAQPAKGPGGELRGILAKWGITDQPGCQCAGRAATMDRNGPEWCEENIGTIVGWLREEAQRRRLLFSEFVAKALIRKAIRNSRENAMKTG